MLCVYLVNEESAYIGMLSNSLKMFRQHNPNVDVVVYYIKDGCRDTRGIELNKMRFATRHLPNDYESFINLCKDLNVEVRVRLPPEESYFSLHRLLLQEINEEIVLLLDGDTFFYGNIEKFPDLYSGYDFVATPNSWGLMNRVPGWDNKFKTFNSGVVLCQHGTFNKWMSELGEYCRRLKDGDHPLSEWLWSVSPECIGREEFSASLFVMDNNLKYRYFEDQHVQMGKHVGDTLILHTLTPNWLQFFNKKKRVIFRPILKDNTNTSGATDNDFN